MCECESSALGLKLVRLPSSRHVNFSRLIVCRCCAVYIDGHFHSEYSIVIIIITKIHQSRKKSETYQKLLPTSTIQVNLNDNSFSNQIYSSIERRQQTTSNSCRSTDQHTTTTITQLPKCVYHFSEKRSSQWCTITILNPQWATQTNTTSTGTQRSTRSNANTTTWDQLLVMRQASGLMDGAAVVVTAEEEEAVVVMEAAAAAELARCEITEDEGRQVWNKKMGGRC